MATRYSAPPGTLVYWGEAVKRGLKNPTIINTSISWNGTDGDAFLRRYAEGDMSEMRKGSFIVSYGTEQFGGPAYTEVKQWLAERGENREPDLQEIVDWSLKYGNKAPHIAKHTGGRRDPLPVKDPRFQHGFTLFIDGVWYMNDLSPSSEGRGPFPNPNGVTEKPLPPDPIKPGLVDPPAPLVAPATVVSKRKGNEPEVHYLIGPQRASRAEAEQDLQLWNSMLQKKEKE